MPSKGRENEYAMASRSIAAYIERSSHFFAVCPTVTNGDHDDVTHDYGSWLQSSGCRFELFALLLSRHDRPPPIVRNVMKRARVEICEHTLIAVLMRYRSSSRTGGEGWGGYPVHDFARGSYAAISRNGPDELL